MTDLDREQEDLGRKLAVQLADNTNVMGGEVAFIKGFLDGMDRQHRTLQQNVGRFIVAYLQHVKSAGDIGTSYYDLRNEGFVKFAQSIRTQLDEAYLPFV